jgi:SOS-response transcriptional repressor LexA
MRARNMSQRALAAALETSWQNVHNWKSGCCDPEAWRLRKLCEVLRCTADELLGLAPLEHTVPLLDGLPAGELAEVDQRELEHVRVDARWRADWAALIRGDSMEPHVLAGDLVAFRRVTISLPALEDGEPGHRLPQDLAAVRGKAVAFFYKGREAEGEALKRVRITGHGRNWQCWLDPDNRAKYHPRLVSPADGLVIQGVAVGLIRQFPEGDEDG